MLNYVRQFIKIRVVFHMLYIWNEDCDPHFFAFLAQVICYLTTVKILKKSIAWKIFARTSLRKMIKKNSPLVCPLCFFVTFAVLGFLCHHCSSLLRDLMNSGGDKKPKTVKIRWTVTFHLQSWTKVVETLSEKDPYGSTSEFSVSNFDISIPSPLCNVVTRWKCPRSVLQHWKGGGGELAINKKDAFLNYGRTPIESVCFAQMGQHFCPWL